MRWMGSADIANYLALTYFTLILGHEFSAPDYGNEGIDRFQISNGPLGWFCVQVMYHSQWTMACLEWFR
jgi:hypothetical protein